MSNNVSKTYSSDAHVLSETPTLRVKDVLSNGSTGIPDSENNFCKFAN